MMKRRDEKTRAIVRSLVVALAVVAGCGKPNVTATIDNASRLGSIQYAYQEAARKLQRPPEKLEEIKPYLAKLGNPDELIVSPRDGKPYVVVWGFDPENPGSDNPVWAYEQNGAGGERMVLTLLGIEAMSDADFARQKIPQPKPPAAKMK